MVKREIPATVTNEDVRAYLAQLAEHIETLEKHHNELCKLAEMKSLTSSEKELLTKIINARNNLDSQWKELTPTIQEAIRTGRIEYINK